jgi:hypothetical protein
MTALRGTVVSILLIAVTSLLGGFLGLLLLFRLAYGWLGGMIEPSSHGAGVTCSPTFIHGEPESLGD